MTTHWIEYIPDALVPIEENLAYDSAGDIYDNNNDFYDGTSRGYPVVWTVQTGY